MNDLDHREVQALRKLVKGQDALLAAYRPGAERTPARAIDDIGAAREELAAIEKARTTKASP